jgi:hypothetical protein
MIKIPKPKEVRSENRGFGCFAVDLVDRFADGVSDIALVR